MNTDIKAYVQKWHSDSLRETAAEAVDLALTLSDGIYLKLAWKFSSPERQWTAIPNFVAFRFPTTKDSFTCWIYTRNEINEIDELPFRGSRPKSNPTYQSVRVHSASQLPALQRYIKRAFAMKLGR